MNTDPIAVTLAVIRVLEALDVPYLIGGSLASALHGVPRATNDADLIVDLKLEHVEPFVRALTPEFYADADAIRQAIRDQRSFNLIHLESMFKVDLFVRKPRPFDQAQFNRRISAILATDPERTAFVASAEDTILAKLEWYQMGGGVSDRQWRDILGILKAQREQLDLAYLHEWANRLQLADQLERALSDAGIQ